jgi:hypothetical protein
MDDLGGDERGRIRRKEPADLVDFFRVSLAFKSGHPDEPFPRVGLVGTLFIGVDEPETMGIHTDALWTEF